ncbi:hypothetical protein LTR37_012207 [Vermiconidia calcicola]|uniref:Uncharacterized protein n=1 Tax=Vermiconidia calcicola TaxID=1690605 RepID=A0ACC3N012_9PEZI|nr:hypothetical protein LTR37_012207 [Vermiconidia calcicola]
MSYCPRVVRRCGSKRASTTKSQRGAALETTTSIGDRELAVVLKMVTANMGDLHKVRMLSQQGNQTAQLFMQKTWKSAGECLEILAASGDTDAARDLEQLKAYIKTRRQKKDTENVMRALRSDSEPKAAAPRRVRWQRTSDGWECIGQQSQQLGGQGNSMRRKDLDTTKVHAEDDEEESIFVSTGSSSTGLAQEVKTEQSLTPTSTKRSLEAIDLCSDEDEEPARKMLKSASAPEAKASVKNEPEAAQAPMSGGNSEDGAGRAVSSRDKEIEFELKMLEIQEEKERLEWERWRLQNPGT